MLLFLHLGPETRFIKTHSSLLKDLGGQVKWKSIRIIKPERYLSGENGLSFLLKFFQLLSKDFQP